MKNKSLYVKVRITVGTADYVYIDSDDLEVFVEGSTRISNHQFADISNIANNLLHAGINDLELELEDKENKVD